MAPGRVWLRPPGYYPFQDVVFQWTDTKMDYASLKDRVLAMALNKVSACKPVPMDIDPVEAKAKEEAEYWEHWNEWDMNWEGGENNEEQEATEAGVNYVGEKCLNCGGFGHYARECPTPKGKGKGKGGNGGKGGWKGNGKGKGGKGDGKGGGKSGGKGFKGACWVCGETGHRAWECKKAAPNEGAAAKIEAVEEENYVGGVWEIAHVGSEEIPEVPQIPKEWRTVRRARKLGDFVPKFGDFIPKKCGYMPSTCRESGCCDHAKPKNSFDVLEVTYEDEEGSETEAEEMKFERKKFIGSVQGKVKDKKWKKVGATEITVDSAAEESVCPKDWGEKFPSKRPSR